MSRISRETVYARFGAIRDEYVLEADVSDILPTLAKKPREKGTSAFARFTQSGWFVACICAVVGIGVYIALLGLGQGWFDNLVVHPAGGTDSEQIDTAEETEAPTELVVDCPAEGLYIARTDDLRHKKKITSDGRYTFRNMIDSLSFEPGQADMRADMVVMIDGTYYLYRSATGEVNDPVGNRTAVMTEEDRKEYNDLFELFSVKTGFADELIQITDEDMIRGLKQFILENGTPCTVTRGMFTSELITNEPHCLQYFGSTSVIMTVDHVTDCIVVYFGKTAKLTIQENGDLVYRLKDPGVLSIEHTTKRGEKYNMYSAKVEIWGSGSNQREIYTEATHCSLLDTAFRRCWGVNVSLKSLGYMIDDSVYAQIPLY